MIRHPERVRQFEEAMVRESRTTFADNLALFEAMWVHAANLGVMPMADPLGGIEVDVRLARALHVHGSTRGNRPEV
jgi:hypothetical protein